MTNLFKGLFDSRQHMFGVAFALLSALGFSAKAIFVKLAYVESVDAVTLLALRMAFSVPFFVFAMLHGQAQAAPMTRRDWLAVLLLGLVGYYLASYLDFLGLQYISAGLERLILFLYPTMVVLISALVFREHIGRTVLLALLLSYAGIALVFAHDFHIAADGLFLGASLVFASALAYAVYLVGAGHTIVRIGSMQTSMIGALGPVATIYLAYVFLNEQLSLIQLMGSVLVLIGVMMISLRKRG